jgi:hypothetical protein
MLFEYIKKLFEGGDEKLNVLIVCGLKDEKYEIDSSDSFKKLTFDKLNYEDHKYFDNLYKNPTLRIFRKSQFNHIRNIGRYKDIKPGNITTKTSNIKDLADINVFEDNKNHEKKYDVLIFEHCQIYMNTANAVFKTNLPFLKDNGYLIEWRFGGGSNRFVRETIENYGFNQINDSTYTKAEPKSYSVKYSEFKVDKNKKVYYIHGDTQIINGIRNLNKVNNNIIFPSQKDINFEEENKNRRIFNGAIIKIDLSTPDYAVLNITGPITQLTHKGGYIIFVSEKPFSTVVWDDLTYDNKLVNISGDIFDIVKMTIEYIKNIKYEGPKNMYVYLYKKISD